MSTITKDMRRQLVIAAVAFARSVVKNRWLNKGTGKAQFSNLVSVSQQASCHEEVELYVRYQAGRGLWREEFKTSIIRSIATAVGQDFYKDHGVLAWRVYSVFLSREYTYQDALNKQNGENHRGH